MGQPIITGRKNARAERSQLAEKMVSNSSQNQVSTFAPPSIQKGACVRPYLSLGGTPRFQGCGCSNWQSSPIVRSAVNVGSQAPVVALGFARYMPYTQVTAVTGGSWQFVTVPGQLVVAQPSVWPAAWAQAVAKSPARYGFTLVGSTYVPASLSSGDQYLLAGQ